MKTQPDTNTMEGRHAVERASATCRIECKQRRTDYEWSERQLPDEIFSWRYLDYRIHPEDLVNAPENDSFESRMITAMENEDMALAANEENIRTIARLAHEVSALQQLDGTPCGKEVV